MTSLGLPRLRSVCVILTLVTLAPLPLRAVQDPVASRPAAVLADKAPFELRFDHVTGIVQLRDHRSELLEEWETRGVIRTSAPLAPVPPDRPLLVIVENANSLLYNYTTGATAVGQRRDVRTCTDIGSSFTSTAFLSSVAAIGNVSGLRAQDPQQLFQGGMFSDYVQQMRSVATAGRGQPRGAPTSEALGTRFVQIEGLVTPLVAFSETLEELATSLPDSLRRVAIAADARPIEPMLLTLRSHLERVDSRLGEPTLVNQVIQDRLAEAEDGAIELMEMRGRLSDGEFDIDPLGPLATDIETLGGRLEAALDGVDGWAATLQRTVRDIERAREQSVQGFSTTASGGNYRQVSIEATEANRFEDVVAIRAGRVEIYTEPTVGMNCSISLGFGMMSNPRDYEVRDGVVTNNRSDDLRTAATLNLHLGPNNVPIAALLGVGIGVESAPDFYAGGSVSFLRPVLLNAGVVFQRQQRLPDGLGIGDPADDTVMDRIERRYVAAFFAGISLAP